ncbi:MAG: 2-dehydropantoate 2-reductase [Elusimicrobia bacterium]|nr:2-dehydropantoate 2-reductase [Elusimicrobiota bacterium]
MNIVIVGAGAMGTLFAGFLAKGGNNVTVLARDKKKEIILKKKGIKITGLSKFFISPAKVRITSLPDSVSSQDLIIIFVKSYDTSSVIPSIRKMMGKNTVVLTLQNGLRNYENISKYITKNRIIRGVTLESAIFVKYGEVIHTGKGDTIIDKNDNILSKRICNIFNHCGIKTSLSKSIDSVIWSKLILNCAINPVAAVTGVKNGEIAKNKNYKEVAVESGKEVMKVAKVLGIKILFSKISEKIEKVCSSTSRNINSMLADVVASHKTEIDYLNGAVVDIANKIKVEVPVNKALLKMVKKLEKK